MMSTQTAPRAAGDLAATDDSLATAGSRVLQRHGRKRYRADPLSAEEFTRRCASYVVVSDRWPPRPAPTSWWQTEANRQEVVDRLLQAPFTRANQRTRFRRNCLDRLLDWLERQPGQTWQERWLASGAEDLGRDWVRLPMDVRGSRSNFDRNHVLSGMLLMLCGQVLRPTYRFLLLQNYVQVLPQARRTLDPDGLALLEAHSLATGRSAHDTTAALNRVAWILLHKGGTVQDITVGDCLELVSALKVIYRTKLIHASYFYSLLFETGVFGSEAPSTLRHAGLRGQRSVEEVVDAYKIECAPVRRLLIDYLNARRPEMDYNSTCRQRWPRRGRSGC
jgi:hypothetical protein